MGVQQQPGREPLINEAQEHPAAVRINEAIRMVRISRSRFYRGIRLGEIPVAHFAGQKRIPLAWIEAEIQKALDTVAANSDRTAA
jgi:predicted DNA-binding transcriptional regulator AlpA